MMYSNQDQWNLNLKIEAGYIEQITRFSISKREETANILLSA